MAAKVPSATDPSTSPEPESGASWQRYVTQVLSAHFTQQGHQYIGIPAKVHGDGGLEGFSTTGDGFQAYCDEGSVSTADRATKQKRKITRDLGKLAQTDRLTFWKDLLQTIRISRWHLVVPVLDDKSVLVHARKKGEALRQLGLPHLASDFQATVVSVTEAFPLAVSALLRAGTSYIPEGYVPARADDLQAFATARAAQVQALDGKLRKLPNMDAEDARKSARDQLLSRYLDGENLLARLRATSPLLWEQIVLQRQEHAKNLQTEQIFDASPAHERVSAARDRFRAAVNSMTSATASTVADTLATGAIGLWLLECPLDFPEPPHG